MKIICVIPILLPAVMLVACAGAQPEPASQPAEAVTIFALEYAPGPAWNPEVGVMEQDLAGHIQRARGRGLVSQ